MKKLIISIFITLFTHNLMANSNYNANGEMSSFNVGYEMGTIANRDVSGVSIEYNFLFKLNHMKKYQGLGIGLGLDLDTLSPTSINNNINDNVQTIGIQAKIGYTLYDKYNIPVYIRIGVGPIYSYLKNSEGETNIQYSTDINVNVYKGLGFGFQYKEILNNDKVQVGIFYLQKSF